MNFVKRIRYKTVVDHEKIKIVFRFVLVLVFSFIGGVCFFKALDQETLNNLFSIVCKHFASPFGGNMIFSKKLQRYLVLCWSDILSSFILFTFSFSYISYFVSNLVIVYQGISLGISTVLLSRIGVEYISFIHIISYLICRIVILLFLMHHACNMAHHYYKFRHFNSCCKPQVRLISKELLVAFAQTISTIGTVFIIKAFYSFVIYIF